MKSAVYLKTLVFIVGLLSVVLFSFSCRQGEKEILTGKRGLDFTLESIDGNKVTLSGLRGKVVLLEFWATWCPPCRDSVPEMNMLFEKFKGRNFELLAISVDQGGDVRSTVGSFVKQYGMSYTVLLDDRNASKAFEVTNIPVIIIIDKEGKPVKRHIGFMPGLSGNLSKEIEALL